MADDHGKPKPLDPAPRSELMDRATRPAKSVSEDLERAVSDYLRATQEQRPTSAAKPERNAPWH